MRSFVRDGLARHSAPLPVPAAHSVVTVSGLGIEATRDVDLIASIHAETVSFAYAGFFPQDSPAPTVGELAGIWAARLADRTATALVCRAEGRVVGTVMVRQDPDFAGEGQLVGLHVLPDAWGRGVGTALHDAGLQTLAEAGFKTAGLWVIAQNQRARTMYSSRGWVLVAGVELDIVGVTEVRYRKDLRAASVRSTPALTLRPTGPDDLGLLVSWLQDRAVYEWWGGAPVSEEEVAAKYTGRRQPSVSGFIIEHSGTPVGYGQGYTIDATTGGVDLFLCSAAQGNRLGSPAARLLVDHLLSAWHWRSVIVDPSPDNERAIRTWHRAGFRRSGTLTGDSNVEMRFAPDITRT